MWLPNPRLQRTRWRSPLSRQPLGLGRLRLARVSFLAFVAFVGMTQYSDVVWTAPGDVQVIVIDRDGSAIGGVSIELRPLEKDARVLWTTTDSNGRAALKDVPRGQYLLTFELSGFVKCSIGPFEMSSRGEDHIHLPEFKVMMNPIRLDG